jgi:hypothetical protein
MWKFISSVAVFMLFYSTAALGADLTHLANCSIMVFNEIAKTGTTWSGKQPEGCYAKIKVTYTSDGPQVTAWFTDKADDEWAMTSFTVNMNYSEISNPKALAVGNRDIVSRAQKLGKCLNPIVKHNDPSGCLYTSNKEYSAGEMFGTERNWKIWLDDDLRKTILNYSIGDMETLPSPDAGFNPGESLPPGTELHLLLR